MAKVPLPDVGTLSNPQAFRAAINERLETIEAALDNTVSRDGSVPNHMEADLDLNDNDLLNVGTIDAANILKNGVVFEQAVAYADKIVQLESGDGLTTNFELFYDPASLGNLQVSVDGLILRPGVDFTYTGLDLDLAVAPSVGVDNVVIYYDSALPIGDIPQLYKDQIQDVTDDVALAGIGLNLATRVVDFGDLTNSDTTFWSAGSTATGGPGLVQGSGFHIPFSAEGGSFNELAIGNTSRLKWRSWNGPWVEGATIDELNSSDGGEAIGYNVDLTGSVNRTVDSVLKETISVLDFGAVADSDSSGSVGSDNTAAFQAAIDATPSAGTLYIPAGFYKFSGNLTCNKSIRIVGAGRNATRIFWSGTGVMFSWTGSADNSHISDVWWESLAGQMSGTNTGFKGYTAASNRHLTFERVYFRNFSFAAMDISDCYNIRVKECRFLGCGSGAGTGCVKFTHITFADNDACNGALFDNCYFGSSSYTSVFGDTVSWTTFLESVFESMTYTINLPSNRETTFIGCYTENNTNPGLLQRATFINTLRANEAFTVSAMRHLLKDASAALDVSYGSSVGGEPSVASGTMARLRRNEVNTANSLLSLVAGTNGQAGIRMGDSTSERGRILYDNPTNAIEFAADGTTRWKLTSTALRPESDNAYSLGLGSFRPSVIYAATGSINTSDARTKTPVTALSAAELAAAAELAKEIGTFKFLAAVEEKGDAARMHVGMTVQRAMEIMESHGLNPMDYGFICYDEWDETPERWREWEEEVDASGAVVVPAGRELAQEYRPAGSLYSFRPDELLMFCARGFEHRLSTLEAALNT